MKTAKVTAPEYYGVGSGQSQSTTDQNNAEQTRLKQQQAGQASTILTSAQGTSAPAATAQKTLLGQ